jgi:hypothetical protein
MGLPDVGQPTLLYIIFEASFPPRIKYGVNSQRESPHPPLSPRSLSSKALILDLNSTKAFSCSTRIEIRIVSKGQGLEA